jgi:hypothetical protein
MHLVSLYDSRFQRAFSKTMEDLRRAQQSRRDKELHVLEQLRAIAVAHRRTPRSIQPSLASSENTVRTTGFQSIRSIRLGRDGGDAVNGNAEFAEASDMMSDHTLPLPVVQRRCLSVVERLAFFEHLIDQEQLTCATAMRAGAFSPPDRLVRRQNLSLRKQFLVAAAAQAHSVSAPRSQGFPPVV